jgi:short subunit dehydrogenase-like uncharacterized protein
MATRSDRTSAARKPEPRRYDVVLYGATGFVGRQTVAYMARQASGLRLALAGRSKSRLEEVRAAAGPGAADAGILVADAGDAAALDALAAQAHVVLSTAGPFALMGSELVAACVRQRTHYVDITGETPWVRDLIDRHHEQAARDGTRIVPCCGFDSVPSDLGAWLLARALWQRWGEPCVEVKACHTMRGGVNGGTLASALNMASAGELHRLRDPFLLNPAGTAPVETRAHADPLGAHHDADFKAWLAPFVMGPINTRVVRRSAALLAARGEPAYGAGFRYQEYLRVGRGPLGAAAATSISIGMAMGQEAMRWGTARRLARTLAVPPGAGPSQAAMDGGSFHCALVGRTAAGHELRGRIAGRGDPGNRATTVFVCEAASALAQRLALLPPAGGVLTPATAFGDVLAQRLVAAGMTVEPAP